MFPFVNDIAKLHLGAHLIGTARELALDMYVEPLQTIESGS